jgi:23S rRNA pseudouridine1911/1915/1917 synthase
MINDNDEFEIPESEYELGEDIGDVLGDEGDEEYAE